MGGRQLLVTTIRSIPGKNERKKLVNRREKSYQGKSGRKRRRRRDEEEGVTQGHNGGDKNPAQGSHR